MEWLPPQLCQVEFRLLCGVSFAALCLSATIIALLA